MGRACVSQSAMRAKSHVLYTISSDMVTTGCPLEAHWQLLAPAIGNGRWHDPVRPAYSNSQSTLMGKKENFTDEKPTSINSGIGHRFSAQRSGCEGALPTDGVTDRKPVLVTARRRRESDQAGRGSSCYSVGNA